jgi:hypothetical protein
MYISTQPCLIQEHSDFNAFSSIFENLEEILFGDSSFQDAVAYYIPVDKLDSYRCIVDAIVCNTFPEFESQCRDFYDGGGLQLRELITEKEQVRIEKLMIKIVAFARINFEMKRAAEWGRLCLETKLITKTKK